jgi:hypothetical protein
MRFERLIPFLVTAAFVCGCGDGPGAPSTPATLSILLKDAPYADAQAVFVTFSDISVNASGGSFITLPFASNVSTRTCDLKKLASTEELLGTTSPPTGHYTQIRLVVASATLYFDNPSSGPACGAVLTVPAGRNASVMVPSGEVRINQEFDVMSSKATAILLDFDGGRSVNLTGGGVYMLAPVISVVNVR